MAGYSPALLDEIRTGADIVDLVGRFVNLKKAGVNWKGLCPFHAEKTPSFMVNPRKGIFHCFGCGVGGDAFGFLMRQDRLSFPEAVRALAKTAGIALPEEDGGVRVGDSGREELLRVMDLAAEFYADALWKRGGEKAREYLDRRRIDRTVARKFRLGYAPGGWDTLLRVMHDHGISVHTLVTAGLVLDRQSGEGHYDRFRDRFLFPICDVQGKVIAFGGRAFGDEQPKYLNSPETPLYTKGNFLFGLGLARDMIRAKNRVLVVEGYVDCVMAHQFGFEETVAALGTASTPTQLYLLRRHCPQGNVVTFFDADSAGQKAAERAEALLELEESNVGWSMTRAGELDNTQGFRVKVAELPSGHDPDTFLQANGSEAFEQCITSARSVLSYLLDRTIAPKDLTTHVGTSNAFARVALLLAKVTDAQEATSLAYDAARRLGVDPTQLWIESQRLQEAFRRPRARTRPAAAVATPPIMERDFVALLLHAAPARTTLLPLVDEADVSHAGLRAIVVALRRRPDAAAEGLMSDLADEAARGLLAALLVEERAPEGEGASIAEFQRRLDRRQRLRRMRELSRGIADAQATGGADAPIQDALQKLDRESKEVYALSRALASDHPGPEGPQGVQTHE